jgi:hypothetical protein
MIGLSELEFRYEYERAKEENLGQNMEFFLG